ncbi:adenylate/guanylate cyclase domain-containing protein [Spirochaeta africana]|uniref:Family 3 adenylate cyclase n=1 Tax=Spirochaeta africana (strain ATCC 700263 / DSM 8902 / Z-7692) TaxID=889378 RepID=H9UFW5_SPIAZ|nr:adenylate/guanylate cyclase domain-containing protein [Spirochaeta africana]AFG36408.1 family 3 adenylate cyclase [Spirochaeta africana DSM 8902]
MTTQPDTDSLRDGERRTVSILFSDMHGFSALSEQLDPEEIDSIMSRVFGAYREIVERQDGTVEKYIGDALVAVFGVPHVHEDDPERAVNAALDFLGEMNRLNSDLARRGLKLQFRTAIHTGLVTTGNRGAHRVVTGHAMSIASRLEQLAPLNGILVSQSAKEQCENDFYFGPARDCQIKGSQEAITAYPVVGRAQRPYPSEAIFCGRPNILKQLTARYVKHSPASPACVAVTGDAGIGKTALMGRFLDHVRTFPGFHSPILYARARRFHSRPLEAFGEAIANWAGLQPDAAEPDNQRRLLHAVQIEHDTAEAFLQYLYGSGSADTNRSFSTLARILAALAHQYKEAPYSVILCIDDAGYLDQPGRELLQYHMSTDTAQVFCLLADRTAPPLATDTLTVPPLDSQEAHELIDRLHPDPMDAPVRSRIMQACQGNPLFIREFVRFVREHPDSSQLPFTVQNIFLSSIDRYPAPVRNLLKKLTVFVLNFTPEDALFLQEHTNSDHSIVTQALQDFEQHGLLIHSGGSYSFRHSAFKKAVYDSLLHHNRRILHRIIADRMRESAQPHTLRLLHHLIAAEQHSEAAELLANAPQRFLNLEYEPYISAVLQHAQSLPHRERIQLLFTRSALLFNNGQITQAEHSLHEIIALALEQRSASSLATACHLLTGYNLKSGAYDKAYLNGCKALRSYPDDPVSRGHKQNVLGLLASSELLRGHIQAAEYLLKDLAGLADPDSMTVRRARGEHALLQGDYTRALQLTSVQIEHRDGSPASDISDRDFAASLQLLTASAYWQRCDYPAIRQLVPGALELHGGLFAALCTLHAYLAAAEWHEGQPDPRLLEQARLYLYRISNDFDRIAALAALCDALLHMQEPGSAEEYARQGLALGLHHSISQHTTTLQMAMVEICDHRGDQDSARFFLQEAGFLLDHGMYCQRKDRILYHGYSLRLMAGDAHLHRSRLVSLVEEEQAAIASDELFSCWRSARSYGMIAGESE